MQCGRTYFVDFNKVHTSCSGSMLAICITVMEGGSTLLVNGRTLKVAKRQTLGSLLTKVCGTSNAYPVEHVQSACTAKARNRFQHIVSSVQ